MAAGRAVTALFLIALAAGGCGFLTRGPIAARQCNETPKGAVETFLRGIAEFSIFLIKAVIPAGLSPFEVFGDGDRERGRQVVRELVRYPEVYRSGEEPGSAYLLAGMRDTTELAGMRDTTEERVRLITVERVVDLGEEERRYQRRFYVRFDAEGNCITAVRALDPAWIRIR